LEKIFYFDNAATSFPKPESVYENIDGFMRNQCANPGRAAHKMSLESSRAVFRCRELICKLFKASSSEQIIFTSNATEALNLAIIGFLKQGATVLTSSAEHNSVMRPLNFLAAAKRVKVARIKHNSNGIVDYRDFKEKLSLKPSLVVVNHASNVFGAITDLEPFLEYKKKSGFRLLVDASQSAGVTDIDLSSHEIDFLAFTGHKSLYGVQGTGGLYVKEPDILTPIKFGGTGSFSENEIQPEFLPDKFESGTPNCVGLTGLQKGVEFVMEKGVKNIFIHKKKLVKYFIDKLNSVNGIRLFYGESPENNVGVVSLIARNVSSSSLAMILDRKYNIAVRPGLHCAPFAHKVINTFPTGTVRFSFSIFNNIDELDYAVKAVKEIISEKSE